tara:strand:+ start:8760 stop:9173 length:414 start_codon:yes stop_codon:yes gene_type:complete
MDRPTKYVIAGYNQNHKKTVKEVVMELTNLKVANQKLRPKELAHTHYEFCILHPNCIFNNPKIPGKVAEWELEQMKNYNIKVIYLFSNHTKQKAINLNTYYKYYKEHVDLVILEEMFRDGGLHLEAVLSSYFKDYVS